MRQRMWAAALWSGGVISHRSAAALVAASGCGDLRASHVTVDDRRFRKPVPGVRLHRVPLGRLHCIRFDTTCRSRIAPGRLIELLRTRGV